MRVERLGLRVWFRVWGVGACRGCDTTRRFRTERLLCALLLLVLCLGLRPLGFGFRVSGFGFRVSGFGFRVSGLGLRA